MSGAWRSLVARVLWEHTFLLTRSIAITDFLTFITNYIVTESDKILLARVLSKYSLFEFNLERKKIIVYISFNCNFLMLKLKKYLIFWIILQLVVPLEANSNEALTTLEDNPICSTGAYGGDNTYQSLINNLFGYYPGATYNTYSELYGTCEYNQYKAIDNNNSEINSNTSNISTNTSNISTNTSNISTNTSNISTNASAIETLQGSSSSADITANTNKINTNTSNINSLGEGVAGSTALTAALSALPQISKESKTTCGVGTGAYSSRYAVGFGCASKVSERIDVNAGGSYVFGGSKSYGGGTLDSGVVKAGFVFKLGELNKPTQISFHESNELKKEVKDLKAKNDEIITQNQKLLARLEKLENIALKFKSSSEMISVAKKD